MPMFMLHRSFSLSTKSGHVLDFKRNIPLSVPPECIPDVIAIGAIPSTPLKDSEDVIPPDASDINTNVMSPDVRESKYFDAFDKMKARGQRDDFMANGQPQPKKVGELTGFDVTPQEREEMWSKYNATHNATHTARTGSNVVDNTPQNTAKDGHVGTAAPANFKPPTK